MQRVVANWAIEHVVRLGLCPYAAGVIHSMRTVLRVCVCVCVCVCEREREYIYICTRIYIYTCMSVVRLGTLLIGCGCDC